MIGAVKAASVGGLILLLCIFPEVRAVAQSGPTLMETYQWIASKMPDGAAGVPEHDLILKPEMWWKDCDLQFYAYFVSGNRTDRNQYENTSEYREVDIVSLSLKSLNVGSAKNVGARVTISTTQSNPVVNYNFDRQFSTVGGRGPMAGSGHGGSATLIIQVENAEMAERMKKAVVHAITLCGGGSVKEVF